MYINGCMSVIYVQCVKYDRLEGNEVQDLLESFKAYFIGCKLVCSGVWSNEQVIYLNTFSYPIFARQKIIFLYPQIKYFSSISHHHLKFSTIGFKKMAQQHQPNSDF